MRLGRVAVTASLLAVVLLGGRTHTQAQGARSPTILGCKAEAPGWRAHLELRDDASARIAIERGGKRHQCPLTLERFTDKPNAIVAMMSLGFARAACAPALPAEDEKALHAEIPLILKWGSPKKPPTGSVQWLRTSQVTPCRLTAFKGEELRRNAEKWRLGTWGPPEPAKAPSVQ